MVVGTMKPKHPCADCGSPCLISSVRCAPCYNARRASSRRDKRQKELRRRTDACPDCGEPKWKTSRRCRACSYAAQIIHPNGFDYYRASKVPCVDCGSLCDRKAERCRMCAGKLRRGPRGSKYPCPHGYKECESCRAKRRRKEKAVPCSVCGKPVSGRTGMCIGCIQRALRKGKPIPGVKPRPLRKCRCGASHRNRSPLCTKCRKAEWARRNHAKVRAQRLRGMEGKNQCDGCGKGLRSLTARMCRACVNLDPGYRAARAKGVREAWERDKQLAARVAAKILTTINQE